MVKQLACTEPDCPPVETVIAVLHHAGTLSRTVHRAPCTVAEVAVAAALRRAPGPLQPRTVRDRQGGHAELVGAPDDGLHESIVMCKSRR